MIVGTHSFPVTGDGEHNFTTICAAAERAAEAGAELLLFPECALTGYPPRDIPSSAAVDFPRLAEMHVALHKLSDARNLALIVGSMVPAENGVRNAVMIFRPGEEPLIYAKRALWGWDRNNFVPGDAPGVFSFRGWKIGVRICYEVRFPEYFRELYRARCDLALTLFYDVTDVPSPDRYDLLRGHLRTRAVENVFPVLSATTPLLRTPARRPCCATLRGAFSSKTRRMRRIFCSSISPNTSRISGNAGGSNSPTALFNSFPHTETSSDAVCCGFGRCFLLFAFHPFFEPNKHFLPVRIQNCPALLHSVVMPEFAVRINVSVQQHRLCAPGSYMDV